MIRTVRIRLGGRLRAGALERVDDGCLVLRVPCVELDADTLEVQLDIAGEASGEIVVRGPVARTETTRLGLLAVIRPSTVFSPTGRTCIRGFLRHVLARPSIEEHAFEESRSGWLYDLSMEVASATVAVIPQRSQAAPSGARGTAALDAEVAFRADGRMRRGRAKKSAREGRRLVIHTLHPAERWSEVTVQVGVPRDDGRMGLSLTGQVLESAPGMFELAVTGGEVEAWTRFLRTV